MGNPLSHGCGGLSAPVRVARLVGVRSCPVMESLGHEWRRLARSAEMSQHALEWAAAEPDLHGSPGEIVARVTWSGYHPGPGAARVLSALLRQAGDPLAARALLQALLPRVRVESLRSLTCVESGPARLQKALDARADLVAECFASLKRHAGADHCAVDRLVMQEATRRLRTARDGERRIHERTVALVEGRDGSLAAASGAVIARTSPERLAKALLDALTGRGLTAEEARLIYATRVKGLPASEVGRRTGLAPRAVYYALARAEHALLEWVA